jgi:ribosome maturation factor RimP
MEAIEKKVHDYIQSLCRAGNIYLRGISISGSDYNRLIKVTVDTDNGITVDECQKLSRKISDLFYRKNIFEGAYNLEVTSPGLNKPLEFPYEFRRNIGRKIEIDYSEGSESRKLVEGELISYNGNFIRVRNKIRDVNIPISKIIRAKVKLQW